MLLRLKTNWLCQLRLFPVSIVDNNTLSNSFASSSDGSSKLVWRSGWAEASFHRFLLGLLFFCWFCLQFHTPSELLPMIRTTPPLQSVCITLSKPISLSIFHTKSIGTPRNPGLPKSTKLGLLRTNTSLPVITTNAPSCLSALHLTSVSPLNFRASPNSVSTAVPTASSHE